AFAQEGTANVPRSSELDIYYPVPYAATPNLNFDNLPSGCEVVDQKENHFRVRNTANKSLAVNWKARGMRIPPAGQETIASPQQAQPPAVGNGITPAAKVGQPQQQ